MCKNAYYGEEKKKAKIYCISTIVFVDFKAGYTEISSVFLSTQWNTSMKALLFFILLLFAACSSQPEWDGYVEEIDGVQYIYNGSLPYDDRLSFELSLIREIDTEHILYDDLPVGVITAFTLHTDGSFYISDSQNNRILHIGADGSVINSFGQRGEGPGEFDSLFDIDTDSDNNVYALDYQRRRISIFDASGNFIRTIPVEEMGMRLTVAENNTFYLGIFAIIQQSDYLVTKYDTEGSRTQQLVEAPEDYGNIFSLINITTIDDAFYCAFPYPYRIERYDQDGNLQRVILREHPEFKPPTPPETRTDGERTVIIGSRLKSEISGVSFHDDGYLFVAIRKEADTGMTEPGPQKSEIDIFSPDGYYLSTIQLPDDHIVGGILNDVLYTFVMGGHTFPSVSMWEIEVK